MLSVKNILWKGHGPKAGMGAVTEGTGPRQFLVAPVSLAFLCRDDTGLKPCRRDKVGAGASVQKCLGLGRAVQVRGEGRRNSGEGGAEGKRI